MGVAGKVSAGAPGDAGSDAAFAFDEGATALMHGEPLASGTASRAV